jgi:hypothetical protein
MRNCLTIFAALVMLGAAACSGEVENGLSDSRPEFMQEVKVALARANIPFREDAKGFIRYPSKYQAQVNQIRETLHKELSAGVVWTSEDQETRDYMKSLLASMGLKYVVEPRSDGEWIRWFPANEAQQREIGQKVAEYRFNLKRQKTAK